MSGFQNIISGGGGDKATSILVEQDRIVVRHDQDISEVMESIKAERDANSVKFERRRDTGMRKFATIPNVVIEDLIARGIWNDPDRLKAWLASDEAQVYKCIEGYKI